MKRLFLLIALSTISFLTFSQSQRKYKKLSAIKASEKTSDQRFVYETNRKSKGGKKNLSMKKRVSIEKKQDHSVRKLKYSKRKRPK